MSVGTYHQYSGLLNRMAKGEIDFASDTFIALLLQESYTPDQNGHADLADLVVGTHEVTDTDYARVTLTGLGVTEVSGQTRINFDNIDFGDDVDIEGKYLVIFDDSHADDALVCFVDLNTAGTSATVSSTGGDFDILTGSANELTFTPTAYSAGN